MLNTPLTSGKRPIWQPKATRDRSLGIRSELGAHNSFMRDEIGNETFFGSSPLLPEIIIAADIIGIIEKFLERFRIDSLLKFGMQRKRSHRRVLAHERKLKLAERFLHGIGFMHISHDSLCFLQVRRKQQHANDNVHACFTIASSEAIANSGYVGAFE